MAELVDLNSIRAQLEAMYDPEDLARKGTSLDKLLAASSHPQAAEEIARIFARERSSVKVGAPAPNFSLPWLSPAPDGSERVTLSDHFGKRPVALVFGSYT